MSYIKLLVGYNTVVPKNWIGNTDTAFHGLEDTDKASFVLEQSVFVNYLRRFYNNRPPILLKSYFKTVEGYAAVVNQINETNTDMPAEFKEDTSFINELLFHHAVSRPEDMITRLGRIASNENFPHVCDASGVSFYRPFLMFYGPNGNSVSLSEAVSIPTLALRGRFVFVNFSTKVIGYRFNDSVEKALANGPYPIVKENIFGFLSGYNWKDINFSQLLGILSTYCFDLDSTNVPSDSYEMIYKLCKTVVTAYTSSVSPYVDSLSLSFDDTAIRRLFIAFLIDLRKIHSLKLDDAHTLAKLMGNDKQDDIENLNAYLEATSASDVSAEMLNSFKRSIFSDFEELLIENRSSKKKEKVVAEDISSTKFHSSKENLKALYLKDMRITDTAAFEDFRKVDESDTSWSVEASGLPSLKDLEPDEDASTTSDDVGATADDDTAGTESDTDKDPSTMENDKQDPMSNPNGQQEQENAHVPDLPDVSDKSGVKLELSSSESTDTVFYRLELKTYINSVLANPPKTLSVQKIEALKKIKSFWMNILAPQCLYDVLSTLLKVPSMFKIHKHKGK